MRNSAPQNCNIRCFPFVVSTEGDGTPDQFRVQWAAVDVQSQQVVLGQAIPSKKPSAFIDIAQLDEGSN
jgi:hypothetical protein